MIRRGFIFFLLPALVADVIYLAVVYLKEMPPLNALTVAFFTHILLRDLAVYVVLAALCGSVRWVRYSAAIPAIGFVVVRAVDACMLYFGQTLLEWHHLQIARADAIFLFLGPTMVAAVIGLIALIIVTAWVSAKHAPGVTFFELLAASVLATLIFYVNIPEEAARRMRVAAPEYVTGNKDLFRRLTYLSSNSLFNVVGDFLSQSTRRVRDVSEIAKYRDVIEKHGIALGPKNFAPLKLKPFRRVIVVHTESLSLDMLGGYNRELPRLITPFYSSDVIRARMFTNYRTTNSPTIPGLTCSFSSHPNWPLTTLMQFPQSWVRLVREDGFQTYFIRSASTYFGRANILFTRAGFDHLIGREDFEKRPELAPLISGLGACDRLVFNKAIEVLKEHRDDKIYMSILGADTHEPNGRQDYGGLPYPPLPPWLDDNTKPPILRAIFRHDYDIGRFIQMIEEEGLYDEETLIILTADHAHPLDGEVQAIPGYPEEPLARIALVLLTPQVLPELPLDTPACQMDLGPTILHLLDLPVPDWVWGESLFHRGRRNTQVGFFRDSMSVTYRGQTTTIGTRERPIDDDEAGLLSLFNSYFVVNRGETPPRVTVEETPDAGGQSIGDAADDPRVKHAH